MSNDANDARLSTGLPGHPKTKKLIRRLGPAAGWYLVRLILWARDERPDGNLAGMSSEDIELAIDWTGENDAFVAALAGVGFLDGVEGAYQLHDWEEHQPWSSGSEARSEKARWASLCRRHGREEAARLMPEYSCRIVAPSNGSPATGSKPPATGSELAEPEPANRTNSPAPSPNPNPNPNPLKAEELLSSAKPTTDLLGTTAPPADIAVRRSQRLAEVTGCAIEVYNRLLAKPTGKLPAVNAKVGLKTRQEQVQRSLQTASEICEDQSGDKKITPEFWESYFTSCAEDPWMRGDGPYTGGHANWKPDFEYLTRKATMLKVFERATQEDAA